MYLRRVKELREDSYYKVSLDYLAGRTDKR